jgi:proline iminopeptidase
MTKLTSGEYDVVLNGIRIHYTILGSGPALIAHSGGPGLDARLWEDFARIDEFTTVIAIHPRGSGLSASAPGDAYTLPDYTADVKALILHLGLEKPILMGWSHGGMVAQQFAFTYPDSLSKLILYDTSACIGGFLGDIDAAVHRSKDQPWYEESLAALKKSFAADYESDEEFAQLVAHLLKFYFKHYDTRAEAYLERTKDFPIHSASNKLFNEGEGQTMDLRPHLKHIQVPTLVVVGKHDFIANVAMAEEMVKHIPNARLEVFEDSGHFVSVEEPDKFYRVVNQFVFDT